MKNIKHLIDPNDLSNEEILEIIELGIEMESNPKKYADLCKGKILGSLFYEPSTRTKFSFDSAMLRLGGNLMGFTDANTTAAKKGESLGDTIKVMGAYTDILVIRHPKEGAPKFASEYSSIPVINAGDGGHQHPTQTLTDLITITKHTGNISNHTIAFCGDLKFGRTVHSLIETLSRFKTKKIYLVSPKELRLPNSLLTKIKSTYDISIEEVRTLEEVMDKIDILYMTRIQKERFFNEEDYIKLKNSYILTNKKIAPAKDNLKIMHPLPRVNEISPEVDTDKRAIYFDQARLGVYVRMALIAKLLGEI